MPFESLLTDTWPTDRVVVGRYRGAYVALERGYPLLVVGPPRVGKTTALMMPNVARWAGPVVATSIRSDVADITDAQRSALGTVHVFDPTGSLGDPATAHYDFLTPCADYDVARRTANTVVNYMHMEGVRDGEFWRTAAARLVTVLLHAAARGERQLDAVTHWLVSTTANDAFEILHRADEPRALEVFEDFYGRVGSDSYVGSVRATALAAMQTYEDTRVARSVGAGGFDPDRFVAAPADTLYVCLAPEEQAALAPYSALTVDAVVAAAHRRARHGAGHHAPLLLALDEAMNIAPLRDLAVLAATAAGTGIQLMTVAHDCSQIIRTYGEAEAHTIVANHSLLLLGGGLREHALAGLLDRLVDPRQVPDGTDWTGSPSEWVRRLAPSQGLLIHRDLPPLIVDLTRWFEDERQVIDHLEAVLALDAADLEPPGDDPTAPFASAGDVPDGWDEPDVDTVDWPRFECGPTGVSARFPASPRYEHDRSEFFGVRHLLLHEHDGLAVTLDVTQHESLPSAPADHGMLEEVASTLAHDLDAELVGTEPVRIGRLPALDVDLREGGHRRLMRLAAAGTCLVAAQVRSREPAEDVFAEFAGTVRITDPIAGAGAGRTVELRVDRSGRITVPAWMRMRLTGPLVMSRWQDRLRVWNHAAFEEQVASQQWVDDRAPDDLRFLRGVLASSSPVGLDDRGRLCIPERFRLGCGIGLVVVLTATAHGFDLAPLR